MAQNLKDFFAKMSGKQIFALLTILIFASAMVARPELANVLSPLTKQLQTAAIEEWNDQGVGGSPYQTWKPYDAGVVYVNVSGTIYYCQMDGESGKMSAYSTNKTAVQEWTIDNVTAGSVYIKENAFEGTNITIPENVMVIEQLNGVQKRYINVADTQGSPYTISTDGTNYFCQDSAGSYINSWSSTNASYVINTAISDLTSGGKIFVKAGTYVLDLSIWDSGIDDINIQLEKNAILKRDTNMNTHVFDITAVDNWYIRGGQIDGNDGNQDSADDTFGINFNGTYFCRIEDVEIYNFRNTSCYGINVCGYSSKQASGNFISDCNLHDLENGVGVGTAGSYADETHISNNEIREIDNNAIYVGTAMNVITDNILLGVGNNGVTTANAYGNLIENNQIDEINNDGVHSTNSYNTISGNDIANSDRSGNAGVYLEDSQGDVVSGNNIWSVSPNNFTYGIVASGTSIGSVIQGNKIEGMGGTAIDLASNNHQILGNKVISGAHIAFNGGETSGNIIANNYFYGTGESGVLLSSGSGGSNIFSNNKIYGATNIALYLAAKDVCMNNYFTTTSANVAISASGANVEIIGNTGFTGFNVAIQLSDSADYSLIEGNNVWDTAGYYGVQLDGSYCSVEGNYFTGCGGDAVFVTGDSNSISNNYITGNGGDGIQVDGDADNNSVQGNFITETVGINIDDATCNATFVDGNNLSGCTTDISDSGTGTIWGANLNQTGSWVQGSEP